MVILKPPELFYFRQMYLNRIGGKSYLQPHISSTNYLLEFSDSRACGLSLHITTLTYTQRTILSTGYLGELLLSMFTVLLIKNYILGLWRFLSMYSSTQKGYKYHQPPSKRFYVMMDVTFHEHESYFHQPYL